MDPTASQLPSGDGPSITGEEIIAGVKIDAPVTPEFARVLTPAAMKFVAKLHRAFNARRLELLHQRQIRQAEIAGGKLPDFLASTASIRDDPGWQVAPTPPDLQKRRVEITGPNERKMMINGLNSGASIFMADFEDANYTTWTNIIEGQINLSDAIEGRIRFTNLDGKEYRLNDETEVLMVRPRGWHLEEKQSWWTVSGCRARCSTSGWTVP